VQTRRTMFSGKLFVSTAAGLFLAFAGSAASALEIAGSKGSKLNSQVVASFDEPWAMTFLPGGAMLVTTKPGKMFHVTQGGKKTEIASLWPVAYAGQGGLGDVVLHPDFARNRLVYVSFAESLDGSTAGAAVVRAKFEISGGRPRLTERKKIWTQTPKVSGAGHYSHRMAFGPDGKLFITAGDRQELTPAQAFDQALGKIIRLNDDGSVPKDNPWQDRGELAKTFWTMGHRNPLGIAFDAQGRLWAHEMGPRGGDELNLIVKGRNYGWPLVSQGRHYSGERIPAHRTRPEFAPPKVFWVPSISPAGFVIYSGNLFTAWKGNGFLGGLSGRALVRVEMKGGAAREAERYRWGKRVREVEQGPEGALWVLEDGGGGRLLKLTPAAGVR
jgi:glucose/arabinose dehydrogenase